MAIELTTKTGTAQNRILEGGKPFTTEPYLTYGEGGNGVADTLKCDFQQFPKTK